MHLRFFRGLLSYLLLLLCAAAGCAHQRPQRPRRLAIVPVDTMGVAASEGKRLRAALQRQAQKRRSVQPAAASRVNEAVEGEEDRCRLSDRCLSRVGKATASELVLAATLAGLGDTRLVRARLVRVQDALLLQDLQETIRGDRRDAVERSAVDLTRRLFPETTATPWYRRWWFWTTVAVAVGAGVGVTVWLAVDGDGSTDRDPSLVHVGDL